ncbi:MAG: DNA/RNA nuclease SfsA [Salinirussus sp.]
MEPVLHRYDDPIVTGRLVGRQNRFVLSVDIDGRERDVFLDETGRLTTVLVDDATVYCIPADDPDRATEYTAVAVETDTVVVSIRAAMANELFITALEEDHLPTFADATVIRREPPLPDHGRTDVQIEHDGQEAYVEVKAVTHVEDGTGKFPDAPSERAVRHLRGLTALVDAGTPAHAVFVCQRPDATVVKPYEDIHPAFATELRNAVRAGVSVHALAVGVDLPVVRLTDPDVPVEVW